MRVQMLRITGCSNSSFWYSGKVGAVVPLIGLDAGEYVTREPSGFVNIVKIADAELVDVIPSVPECVSASAPPVSYRVVVEIEFNRPAQLDKFDPKTLEQEAFSRVRDLLIYRKVDATVKVG